MAKTRYQLFQETRLVIYNGREIQLGTYYYEPEDRRSGIVKQIEEMTHNYD